MLDSLTVDRADLPDQGSQHVNLHKGVEAMEEIEVRREAIKDQQDNQHVKEVAAVVVDVGKVANHDKGLEM